MKVLMFGWEFPPFSSGGLGTACKGLTKGLNNKDIEITFVVPKGNPGRDNHLEILPTENLGEHILIKPIDSLLKPYQTSDSYSAAYWLKKKSCNNDVYGANLHEEVIRYSEVAKKIASETEFDIIHAHDWMTYPAAVNAKKISGKPLVVHIHATEFDRSGGSGFNPLVYDIEHMGFKEADRVIAVSDFTRNKVMKHYGISPSKISVVHNAVEFPETHQPKSKIHNNNKIVLFLGRITLQKGPDYFIDAAKKVIAHHPNVKFVVAGSGDMEYDMIEKVAELGLGKHILFTGFLTGPDIDKAYRMASVYVLPSVSEPFGITPLEAMRNSTPTIISNQSGVSEVIDHCFKSDFWDTDRMANQIIGILRYPALAEELSSNGLKEVQKFNWNIPAEKCIHIYDKLISDAELLNRSDNFNPGL